MVNHQLGGKPAAGISLLVIFRLFEGRDDDCMQTQLGTQLGTLTVARPATPRRLSCGSTVPVPVKYDLGRAICTGTTRTGRIPAQCVNVNECGLILTNGTLTHTYDQDRPSPVQRAEPLLRARNLQEASFGLEASCAVETVCGIWRVGGLKLQRLKG